MESYNKVYLLTGGNLDNSIAKYEQLFDLLECRIGKIVKKSSFYESEPWGFNSENTFVNLALHVNTFLSPIKLMNELKTIEKKMGRKTKPSFQNYADRNIDIDIIFYNNHIITTETINIPHPRMQERMFVLLPLSEIAPDFIHPVYQKSITQLKNECNDRNWVRKFTWNVQGN